MEARVQYVDQDGTTNFFSTTVPKPPPDRHTFTDPNTRVELEASLDTEKDGVAYYRRVERAAEEES
jgi:hypothetical protein